MTTQIQHLANLLGITAPLPAEIIDCATIADAWSQCRDGYWMLSMAARQIGPGLSDGRRSVVLAACDCAEIALPAFEEEWPRDRRPHAAIEMTRRWALGDVSVTEALLDDACHAALRIQPNTRAVYASYAAAKAARCCYHDGSDAASYAARAAGPAGSAAVLSLCADAVRRHVPNLTMLMLTSDKPEARMMAIQCMGTTPEPLTPAPGHATAVDLPL